MKINSAVHSISLNETLIISLIIHMAVIFITSIFVQTNLFQVEERLEVTITSPIDLTSSTISEAMENYGQQTTPEMNKISETAQQEIAKAQSISSKPNIQTLEPSIESIEESVSEPSIPAEQDSQVVENTYEDVKSISQNVSESVSEFLNEPNDSSTDSELSKTDSIGQKNIEEILGGLGEFTSDSTENLNIPKNDFLSGADWTSTPRKTLKSPDLAKNMPEKFKKSGMVYKIKVRLTFNYLGFVTKVTILKSSGEPELDAYFENELKNIRVEESKNKSDVSVTQQFTVTPK